MSDRSWVRFPAPPSRASGGFFSGGVAQRQSAKRSLFSGLLIWLFFLTNIIMSALTREREVLGSSPSIPKTYKPGGSMDTRPLSLRAFFFVIFFLYSICSLQ